VQALFLSLLLTAEEPLRRPDTYTGVNPRYSTGPIENFRQVYVDPAQAPAQLKPAEPKGGTSDLTIYNDRQGWGDVTISGTKIGLLDSLTNGVIHGVAAGTYDVTLTYSNGFVKNLRVSTKDTVAAGPNTTAATTTVAPPPPVPSGDGQKTP
jgi:hypothetical protein